MKKIIYNNLELIAGFVVFLSMVIVFGTILGTNEGSMLIKAATVIIALWVIYTVAGMDFLSNKKN